jgi:hypothetical protein
MASASAEIGAIWRRGQIGWPRGYPLVQAPNAPLLVALAGWVVLMLDVAGTGGVGRVVMTLGLVVWALLEVAAGANLFRRLLGAAILATIFLPLVFG